MSLVAKNITLGFGKKKLLDDVSISLHSHEVLALIGQNGSGKTTLLRALAGDFKEASTQICMNGKRLSEQSALEQAKQRAVLPQHSGLHFPLRVLDVVLLGRNPHGESLHDHEIANNALQKTGMEHCAERFFSELSGGEQQRVLLARTLAQVWQHQTNGTQYLLLDEPTNNLDVAHQHSILATLREFAKLGLGVLLVLHDLNLAAMYADRVAIMQAGRLPVLDSTKVVLQPSTIKEFFGFRMTVGLHPQLGCPVLMPHNPQL